MRSAPRLGLQANDAYSLERGHAFGVRDCAPSVCAGPCATGRRRQLVPLPLYSKRRESTRHFPDPCFSFQAIAIAGRHELSCRRTLGLTQRGVERCARSLKNRWWKRLSILGMTYRSPSSDGLRKRNDFEWASIARLPFQNNISPCPAIAQRSNVDVHACEVQGHRGNRDGTA
jgi:hypothetical protein